MTSEQITEELSRRAIPLFEEFGFEGFVIVGYVHPAGDGPRQRVVFANMTQDPAVQDGLMPIIAFARQWGLPLKAVTPPHPEVPEEPA